MNAILASKVLGYVQATSTLLKRALDELAVHRAGQQKAASVRSDVLQQLLKVGAAGEHQKQAAEAMLGSHAETLGLLKSAAIKLGALQGKLQKTAGDLGEGVDEAAEGGIKAASDYDSLTDGYVGRKTSQRKASDEAILRVMNPVG